MAAKGSSPLTRGGLGCRRGRCRCRGLIPAYAGRTASVSSTNRWDRAHPRLRGADSSWRASFTCWAGSSPLTRGGLQSDSGLTVGAGLIPAYAGRTVVWGKCLRCGGAHPRLRGADGKPAPGSVWSVGSSPLTRGGLPRSAPVRWPCGLIPAYAGRTPPPIQTGGQHTAHPRLRGADSFSFPFLGAFPGSSPLTRGGLRLVDTVESRNGLIPAYAGRTEPS